MKGWKKAIIGAAVLAAASGCVPTQGQVTLERDFVEMKRRLAEVERSLAASRGEQAQQIEDRFDTLSRRQAELQAGVDAMRVEAQSSIGRFEDLARQQQELRDEVALVRDDLGLKVDALEQRLARVEEQAAAAAAAPPVPAAAAQGAPQTVLNGTPEETYAWALALIQNEGNFSKGREAMQAFAQRYPDHRLAPNALYWVGEALYGEKRYADAILQFQDVIQRYAKHPKAVAALLKQGMAFQALGDLPNARAILQKLIEVYPDTEEAKNAGRRLEEWS